VFVLVFAVPALLVVVLGYAVGYRVWAALTAGTSMAPHAEVAGWLTGLLLLAGVTSVAVRTWRGRRRDGR
jgi:cytochrome c oxidase assembly factor CtaG